MKVKRMSPNNKAEPGQTSSYSKLTLYFKRMKVKDIPYKKNSKPKEGGHDRKTSALCIYINNFREKKASWLGNELEKSKIHSFQKDVKFITKKEEL